LEGKNTYFQNVTLEPSESVTLCLELSFEKINGYKNKSKNYPGLYFLTQHRTSNYLKYVSPVKIIFLLFEKLLKQITKRKKIFLKTENLNIENIFKTSC
jgi:hypothetical protein